MNNNFYFLELVDKVQFRMSNKHNNLLCLVSKPFCIPHTRKRIDKRLLAYLLLFYVHSLDK